MYDQIDFEKILAFCLTNNQTYYTLCNEAINLKDSVCAGNILVLDERNYFVEYFYGPGTPRDIETKSANELNVYRRSFGVPAQGPPPPDIVKETTYRASKFHPIEGPYILEFSLYPYPIGKNQTEIIIWEWRLGWLHYQLQANKFLLEENKRLHEVIQSMKLEIEELKETAKDMRKHINDMMVTMCIPRDSFPGLA